MRRRRPDVPPCPDPLVTYDESAWPSWDAWFTARCAWLDDHGQPWDDLGPIPDEPFEGEVRPKSHPSTCQAAHYAA